MMKRSFEEIVCQQSSVLDELKENGITSVHIDDMYDFISSCLAEKLEINFKSINSETALISIKK